jgi:DNA-binding GntR family transcriptional regulator
MTDLLAALYPPRRTPITESETLARGAYRALRKDIIEGRHAPGSKLRVEHLKDHYGVGAGTLREALALLVADALVVVQEQRGFRVVPISTADFADITDVRVLVECNALRQSIARGDDSWEGNVMSAFHRLTLAEERLKADPSTGFNDWENRNQEFHQTLISACGSRWSQHFLGILSRQSERYRRLTIAEQPIARDVHEEHREIFEAALERDADRAVNLLETHIRLTFKGIKHLPPKFIELPAKGRKPARKINGAPIKLIVRNGRRKHV